MRHCFVTRRCLISCAPSARSFWGATLYALTRAHGVAAAAFAMGCRVVEAMLIAASVPDGLSLVGALNRGQSAESLAMLASYVLRNEVALTSMFFALGSLVFACLFVRGRVIPAPLAWLGVIASAVLVVLMPLQLVGLASDPRLVWAWMPMLAFRGAPGALALGHWRSQACCAMTGVWRQVP